MSSFHSQPAHLAPGDQVVQKHATVPALVSVIPLLVHVLEIVLLGIKKAMATVRQVGKL